MARMHDHLSQLCAVYAHHHVSWCQKFSTTKSTDDISIFCEAAHFVSCFEFKKDPHCHTIASEIVTMTHIVHLLQPLTLPVQSLIAVVAIRLLPLPCRWSVCDFSTAQICECEIEFWVTCIFSTCV